MEKFTCDDEFTALLTEYELGKSASELALSVFLEGARRGANIYYCALAAVSLALGWRWCGIGIYHPSSKSVDVIGWWEDGKRNDAFSYQIAGKPCELVLESRDFIGLNQVQRCFPEDEHLSEIGASCYAGYTYNDRYGKIIGHIFAMDDQFRNGVFKSYDILSPIATMLAHEVDITR